MLHIGGKNMSDYKRNNGTKKEYKMPDFQFIGNHNIIIKRKNKAHYYHTIIIELQLYNKKSGTL